MPAQTSGAAATTPDDSRWPDVFATGRVVLGYALTFDRGAQPAHVVRAAPARPRGRAPAGGNRRHAVFPRHRRRVQPADAGASGAAPPGFLNAAPDPDGILQARAARRRARRPRLSGLALAAVAAATGARDMALRVVERQRGDADARRPRSCRSTARAICCCATAARSERFRTSRPPTCSAARCPPAPLRDKIVFVGTTALGTREVVATPLDTLFAGVEVQATVADNLLRAGLHPAVRAADRSSTASWRSVLGIAIARSSSRARASCRACSAAPLELAALWSGSAWLLSTRGLFVSPLFPTIAVSSQLWRVMTLAKFTVERRRADTRRPREEPLRNA